MKAKELRTLLKEGLGKIFLSQGFKHSKQAYYKKEKNVTILCNYGFNSYGGLFSCVTSLLVYNSNIQNILAKVPGYNAQTCSVKFDYTYYSIINKTDKDIETYEDVSSWLVDFECFMDLKGFDIFRKYQSLKELELLYDLDLSSKAWFNSNQISRVSIGLVIAKLTDKSEYFKLVDEYRNAIEPMIQLEKAKFENVIDFLSKYSKEELRNM